MDYEILAPGYWYAVREGEEIPVPGSEEPVAESPAPTQAVDPDFIEVSNYLLGGEVSPEPTLTPTPLASSDPSPTPTATSEVVLSDAETKELIKNCAVGIMAVNVTLVLTLLLLFVNKFFGN